jgi:transcriptional regulator with XRE-family HTH domain
VFFLHNDLVCIDKLEKMGLSIRYFASLSCRQMHSRKKTTVAALRLMLGLTVEEFASLIGKSISAVTSLETGRLALSQNTALGIAVQTGVALDWLLGGNPREKPYVIKSPNGPREKYTLEEFEKIQAAKSAGSAKEPLPNELKLRWAFDTICPWLGVFFKAIDDGEAYLASFLMSKAINELAERFGEDVGAALQATEKTRITIGDEQYLIVDYEAQLGLERVGSPWSSPEAREYSALIRSRISAVKFSSGPEP